MEKFNRAFFGAKFKKRRHHCLTRGLSLRILRFANTVALTAKHGRLKL
jgi:hypothetical protein